MIIHKDETVSLCEDRQKSTKVNPQKKKIRHEFCILS